MGDVLEMFAGALDCIPMPEEGEPAPEVAKLLREIADQADRGEVQAIAVIGVSRQCSTPMISAIGLDINPYVMIGGLDEVMAILRDNNLGPKASVMTPSSES